MKLFTDGSVDPRLKIGYGAYLAISQPVTSFDEINSKIKLKRFDNTSSTQLEIQTVLWALNDIEISTSKIIVYLDCQNIIGLQGRRDRLTASNYTSKKNVKLANSDLYQQFFEITDRIECTFIKVDGHKPSFQKDETDKLFSLVDKASRKALREYIG